MDFDETLTALLVAQQTCQILVAESERLRAAGKTKKADAALAKVEVIVGKMEQLEAACGRSELH